jgi:hypothetical protein
MQAHEIRQILFRQPFVPFTVAMVDGRRVVVNDRWNAAFTYDRASLGAALPAGGFATLKLDLINAIKLKRRRRT